MTAWMEKRQKLRLYVDDVRTAPKGWYLARNFHEAIVALEHIDFHEVSLDHDLASFYGQREMTGRDILNWLIARKMDQQHVPKIIRCHSANPVGADTMEQDIRRYFPEV